MIVTRHRCTGWVEDSLGESRVKRFVDEQLDAFGFDPGQTTLAGQHADLTVATSPTLYFTHLIPGHELEEWDEWTIDGRRYLQDGAPLVWRDPWPDPRLDGVVVRMRRERG